ncbi:E3 ubiquitin-protein ligase bre1 [Quaeritorhiza haematococci]|nr:E3 ubiquitin-protein ligase bre1 [Quaeritorhiza haematococci]
MSSEVSTKDDHRKRKAGLVLDDSEYSPTSNSRSKRINSNDFPSTTSSSASMSHPQATSGNSSRDHSPIPRDKQPATDEDEEVADENLLSFQKQAIWRQMQEYKRLYQRTDERLAKLLDEKEAWERNAATVYRYWAQLHDELQLLLMRVDEDGAESTLKSKNGESAISCQLLKCIMNGAPLSSSEDKQQDSKIDSTLTEKWDGMRGIMKMLASRVLGLIDLVKEPDKRDHETNGLSSSSSAIDELQARCYKHSKEVVSLQADLEISNKKIHDLQSQLEESQKLLLRAEKKIDRNRNSFNSTNNDPSTSNSSSTLPNNTSSSNPDGASSSLSSQDRPSRRSTGTGSSSEEAEEAFYLAESRLKEIDQFRDEHVALLSQIDQLKIAISIIPDERIRETPLYKNMEAEFQFHRQENEILRARLERMGAEIEELQATRRKFIETVESEESSRRKVLETEMRKLESDLVRLRGARDSLQQSLDLRCSRDDVEIEHNQQIRILANARKDRITCLEADLTRLKMELAASGVAAIGGENSNTGFRALLEFFGENPQGNPFEDLRAKLRDAENKIAELEDTVRSLKEAASEEALDRHEILLSIKQKEREIDELQKGMKDYRDLLGTEEFDGDAGKAKKKLGDRIRELQNQVLFYQKSEAQLVKEIETISTAYQELEKQNSLKVLNLTEKEETIMRLLAEKTKYDQKCAMLTKHNSTYNNMALALKRQSDKQLEQIRKLEEREKSLTIQMQNIEKELAAKQTLIEAHRRQASEFMQQCAEMRDRIEKSGNMFTELNMLLQTRTRAYETELDAKRRLQEQVDVLKKRGETMQGRIGKLEQQKKESNADASVVRELDEYKIILQLLDAGANIHFENEKLLFEACKRRRLDLVKLFIENGANPNVGSGSILIDIAPTLFTKNKNGCKVDGEMKGIFNHLLMSGANINVNEGQPLIDACAAGHLDLVRFLVASGVNVRCRNDEALAVAAKGGPRRAQTCRFGTSKSGQHRQ